MTEPLRVANCSGFFGDRLSAAREMVEGGPIDVLTGDYLSELTMSILWRRRRRDPEGGYAGTFLTQMEQILAETVRRGIKVVTNAGGIDPHGAASALEDLAHRLGVPVRVAVVDGDDVLPRVSGHGDDRRILTANAYLGGWGIAQALNRGADVVICGRVTDASVAVGPAAWHHQWSPDDLDSLAGAVVAGHVLECGCQCTGGNYPFLEELDLSRPLGFPIAEIGADGSGVITKHPGTGGAVTIGTITAQLLYEIESPAYLNPDVTARFDTIRLLQKGPDRVALEGVKGDPPPPTLKVGVSYLGGYRNRVTFMIPGVDRHRKAEWVERALWSSLGGRDQFAETHVRFVDTARPNPQSNEEAVSYLTVTVKDPHPQRVGRAFSNAAVELALSSYAGFMLTSPPADAHTYAVFETVSLPAAEVPQRVSLEGERWEVRPAPTEAKRPAPVPDDAVRSPPTGRTVLRPLGSVFGARSGDKGGDANVGVWSRSDGGYAWLVRELTPEAFRELIPEARGLAVERYELPNLRAVNFVIRGLLGQGAAASERFDPQAKTLAEYLRSKVVALPAVLLEREE